MTTSHTPGIWQAYTDPDGKIFIISGGEIREADTIATIAYKNASSKSRANLIAAAPDLLEALQGVTRILEAFSYTTTLGKGQSARLKSARELIAKAKGEA